MTLTMMTAKTVPVTLELAKRFRDMKPLKNERPLKANRVKHHTSLIEKNRFFTLWWGECDYDGVTYRGNGNHTSRILTACFQAHNGGLDAVSQDFVNEYLFKKGSDWARPEDLPEVHEGAFKALIEKFTANDRRDLVDFFDRYDSPDSARTKNDMLGIYVGEHEDLNDIPADKIRYVLAGVMDFAKKDQAALGLSETINLSSCKGNRVGEALRYPEIREVVRWIIETVPDINLYKKHMVGARLCAEVYANEGSEQAESILTELVRQIETDTEPGAGFYNSMAKTYNKPTPESLLKKGRAAVKQIKSEI